MPSDDDLKAVVQRKAKPSGDDPLPRVKLPETLQQRVDDEETLLDQIYDGT